MVVNLELKQYAQSKEVPLYRVAEKFGVNAATFSRWLRKTFSREDSKRFKEYVDQIAKERGWEE